jgi:hypothetical protein
MNEQALLRKLKWYRAYLKILSEHLATMTEKGIKCTGNIFQVLTT